MASLRVCEAAMVAASLVVGRAWHELECDARAPSLYGPRSMSMAHDLVSWPCAKSLLATAQKCAHLPPTERGLLRIILCLQLICRCQVRYAAQSQRQAESNVGMHCTAGQET